MKAVGGILLLIAATVFSRGYAAFEKKRIAEEESFCRFLALVQKEFLLYATPFPGIAEKADEPLLVRNGYLPAVIQTESASEAFAKTEKHTSLSADFHAVLSDFSEHFGREATGEAEKHLALWCQTAETVKKRDEEQAKNNIRLATTLSYSLALGILLLYL